MSATSGKPSSRKQSRQAADFTLKPTLVLSKSRSSNRLHLTRMSLMKLTSAALSFLLTAGLAPAAFAQSTPAEDFEFIQKKAETDPDLRGFFSRFTRAQQDTSMIRMLLDQSTNQLIARDRKLPFDYRVEAQVKMAQARGQVWGQMLSVDLNNDGEITAAELKATLNFGSR
ncbi:MAG: hypothetical protein ABIQ85_03515, partial [Cypionkella sp.]